MKNNKRFTILTIAALLTLLMTSSLLMVPTATAHNPAWKFQPHAYIMTQPNPIGVGQTIVVYAWLDLAFGAASRSAGETTSFAGIFNDYRFHNYQIVITAPNGQQTTQKFDYIADTTSSQQFKFTPDQIGTYKFDFTYPGQAYTQYGHNPNSILVNDTYLPTSRRLHNPNCPSRSNTS